MIEQQLPPHSVEAEESVNGSLLIDGDCFRLVKHLNPDDFFSYQNRLIFNACYDLASRNVAIDEITVAEELDRTGKLKEAGGAAYLIHLASIVPTSLDIEHYAEIVRRLSISRDLVTVASQIGSLGFEAAPDTEAAIQKAELLISNIKRRNNRKLDMVTPMQIGDKMLDMLHHGETSMPWGFLDLDRMTGGIHPQDYVVIGARPSTGKTALMLDTAQNIALRKKNVLFVSAEMTVNPVLERFIAKILHMSILEFRQRNLSSTPDEELERQYMKASGYMSELPIYYLFERRSSDSIWENARKMKESIGLDVIFIDYLQLLSDCYKNSRENHSVAVGYVSHNLKAITTDLNVPVVVASQLNRLVEYREAKRPMLADLRESGDIEQDADVVLLLHRPEMYAHNEEEIDGNLGKLEVLMAKNRQLGVATSPINLQWIPQEYRYGNGIQEN